MKEAVIRFEKIRMYGYLCRVLEGALIFYNSGLRKSLLISQERALYRILTGKSSLILISLVTQLRIRLYVSKKS